MKQKVTQSKNIALKSGSKFSLLNINEFPIWIPIIFFTLTTIIFFSSQLFGSAYFWEDFVEYVYPTQAFAARESAGFVIPFWNPYIFSGMPFIADLQTGFFYPLNRVLNFFVSNDGTLSVWGLQFITILHFFIAQITFYFLIRSWKKSQFAAMISAVSFSFSMLMVCHVIHPMIIYHLAWFPLVLLFFDKGIIERNYRYGIASGLILGMSYLSGHPQTTLFLTFFLALYFIWQFMFLFKNKEIRGIAYIHTFVPAILTIVVALGIFAVQYLPSTELADTAVRAENTYQKSSEGSLEFSQIFSAVVPNIFGVMNTNPNNNFPFYLNLSDNSQAPFYYYWETSFYFGIAALILGLFGAITNFKNRIVGFMIAISIFGFLYALGSNFFIHKIFFGLPFFNLFRMPARMMMFVILGFSVLASFGFDEIISGKIKNHLKFIYASSLPLLISLLSLIGFLGSMINTPGQLLPNITSLGLISFFLGAVIFLVGFFGTKRKINYATIGSTILIITFLDLFIAGSDFNKSKDDPKQLYAMDGKSKEAFIPQNVDDLFRINTRMYNPPYMASKRNQGMVSGFMNTEGYNPLVLKRVNPPVGNSDKIYDLLNVKYELRMEPNTRQPYYFENENRVPRAWMVYKAIVVNENEVKDKMLSGNFDYLNEVVIETTPNIILPETIDSVFNPNVKIREYKNNYIRLEVLNKERNSILVLSEIWYPSWTVFVDNKPARLLRANYSLRAVEIPKGSSKVEMRFASPSFAIGLWITLFTIIISIPALIIGINKKKKE
jgi:hypothetical protein